MAFADFHTHTIFSDGFGTVEEMVESARAKGLLALGISDHSMTPFDLRYCMRPETNIEKYEPTVREAQKRAAEMHGFPVFLGIEWDLGSEIDRERYDYTIGSVHYIIRKNGDVFPVDSRPDMVFGGIDRVFGGNRLDFAKAYFEHVVEHAEKNKPTFMGHFDLLTKFNGELSYLDESSREYQSIALEALDAVLEKDPLIEMNTGAISRGRRTIPYPPPFVCKRIAEKKGRLIFNADAHFAKNVLYGFDDAIEYARACGVRELWYYQNGQFQPASIV